MEFSKSRFDRILVPLDGSQISEQALSYVRTLTRSTTEVTLLHVIPRFEPVHDLQDRFVIAIDEGRQLLHRRASDELRRAADRLRTASTGARVETVVADGDPATEILRAASDLGVGLIVMAAEGFGSMGHFGLGSVADRVARTVPIPVLIVRNQAPMAEVVATTVRRIVVPLDGSDRAAMAVAVAEDLAVRIGVPVLLISVIDATAYDRLVHVDEVASGRALYRDLSADANLDAQWTLDQAGARLIGHRIGMRSELLFGSAATSIMYATAPGDLVVMTNRGRGGGRSWQLGSVAERMISSGPVPVVLVPTGREQEIGVTVLADVFRQDAIGAR